MDTVIKLDITSLMILKLYNKTKADEPSVPHPDEVPYSVYVEAATKHEEWSRRLSAAHLLLGHALVGKATEQHKEKL